MIVEPPHTIVKFLVLEGIVDWEKFKMKDVGIGKIYQERGKTP